MNKLSVAIMTFNEEDKIERCIRSVLPVADEVLVLDSFSTDQTVVIAESLGAKIVSHTFLGYIEQRRLSVKNTKYDWVLALDADEYLSDPLVAEIQQLKSETIVDCYRLNRLSSINGKWIRHGKWFPHRIIRLFRKSSVSFGGDLPHDRIIAHKTASVTDLKAVLLHACNEDIHDRILTINNHSTQAAQNRFQQGKKSNYIRLLLKPFFRFIIEYYFNKGFLDGFYGFVIAKSAAKYVFLREAKLMELHKGK